MIGSATLGLIKESLLATAKEGKVALLFHFSKEGDPIRAHIIKKIRGLERAAEGIDVILLGGTSDVAQEGFDMIIESIDGALPLVPTPFQEMFYEERAHFLEMKCRFQKLDELFAVERPEPRSKDILLN